MEEIYNGIVRERPMWVKILMLIAGGIIFYIQLMQKEYFYVLVISIFILAVFFEKEQVISPEGVDIRYSLFLFSSLKRLEWSEITAINVDYDKFKPDVMLHIAKDVVITRFKVTPDDEPKIIALAQKMNPEIYIVR